jgi:hypothetical protein
MAKTPTSKGKTSKKKAPAASSDGSPTIRLAGPDERLIRERAYGIWIEEGRPHGRISCTGSSPTKSLSERPLRGQRPFWRLRTHPERPAPLDYRRPSTGRRIVVHQRMTTASERSQLRDGSCQCCMASRQCSSSCSISVRQWGRNRMKTSSFCHVGCARSFSLIVANIGIFASVPSHDINAAQPSPFPLRRNYLPRFTC